VDAETGTPVPRFLGRGAKRETLDRLLADAFGSRSQATVIRSEAGMRQGGLLDYLSGKVDGCT
jgi:hypothetical protein